MRKNNTGDGSLLEQLEALRGTVWRCVFAVAAALIPALWASGRLLRELIRYSCPPELKLHYFSPFEPLFVQLDLGLVLAVILASPVILWQIGSFIAPGLYPKEKKALGGFCCFALLLALCGAALGFFFVIPQIMAFSLTFSTPELQPVIGLGNFLKLVIWMILGFALVFELPVMLMIPVRAGLVKVETLKRLRYLFVCGIFFVAALLTPPDVVSQLALGIPGWLLFELTLIFASKVEKSAEDEDLPEDNDAAEEPANRMQTAAAAEKSSTGERRRLVSRSRKIRKL